MIEEIKKTYIVVENIKEADDVSTIKLLLLEGGGTEGGGEIERGKKKRQAPG